MAILDVTKRMRRPEALGVEMFEPIRDGVAYGAMFRVATDEAERPLRLR